jgi:hypothetical protein
MGKVVGIRQTLPAICRGANDTSFISETRAANVHQFAPQKRSVVVIVTLKCNHFLLQKHAILIT